MRSGPLSRAEHKLACLRRIAAGRLDRDRELLLVNFVEEYLLLTPQEQEEYKVLSARNTGRKGNAMWMPWSERVQLEARKEGIRIGKETGKLEGMHKLLLHLLAQQFGPLPEAVRRQVEEITSTRRLTSLAGKVLKARSLGDLGFC